MMDSNKHPTQPITDINKLNKMEKLKIKLKSRFGNYVTSSSEFSDKPEITISGQVSLSQSDITFIQKSIKGHFVNYSIHPASNSVYVKIVADE